MDKKDNIPSKDFQEALDRGIIQREPIFTLNEINYYTFANELQMICANRYLTYQQQIQGWSTLGMSMEVSRDYINDALDSLKSLRDNLDDRELALQKVDDVLLTLKTYQSHQQEFNVLSAIIEMNSIAFIAPCENPYSIDWDYNLEKMKSWQLALASEEGGDFLSFFWKLSSRSDQSWMTSLVDSIKLSVVPVEQMTQEQIENKNRKENYLIMEIYKHKKHLDDLLSSKSLRNRAKQSRVISSLLNLTWNAKASSIIFNIRS